jgi:methionyl-tRNA formyltransferase
MRIAFAGTPEFAAVALQALLEAGHDVALALTQPDRPAGRGMKLQASPVKALAVQHGIAVAQPRSLRLDGKYPDDAQAARQALADARVECLVVAAYGLILPEWVLALPPRGCLNIHASLLPRWRGAAPIHRAVEAGDAETGITIMQMDAGLDTGDMLLVGREPIAPADTTARLHDRLATLGGQLIVQALDTCDELQRTPQPNDGITYAHKIDKAEAAIDWARPATDIERRVRAFDPFPGCSFGLGQETIKVWEAQAMLRDTPAGPGQVLRADAGQLWVACGDGALALRRLQAPGGRRIDAAAFLQSRKLAAGDRLG